jgi:hypothetical protein
MQVLLMKLKMLLTAAKIKAVAMNNINHNHLLNKSFYKYTVN